MRASSMVGRVAWVQTLVSLTALGVVVLGTWLGVTLMLARQTDRTLEDLLERTLTYLDSASEAKYMDWQWLAAEIDEGRPRHVRFALRERASGHTLIELGPAPAFEAAAPGCSDRGNFRVCTRSGARYAAIAASDHALDRAVKNQLFVALGLACVLAGAGVALASVAVTRRAIRPLSELATRVAQVEPGAGQPLQPTATLRELEVLEQRFADLVTRFDAALLRERQFTAHASHELRTPLTLARAEVERLPDSAQAQTALARLESLIQALLWFARAEAPLHGEDMELVNLADVVAQELETLRRKHGAIVVTAALPDEALVRGDERLLTSAAQNLLDNAVKHGKGSEIDVELAREEHRLVLRVSNAGPSIPEPLREQVFIPFVRGRDGTDGFGLGLPFARAVARAHGGELTLGTNSAAGTTLLLRLPLVAWHAAPARLDSVQNGSEG